MQFYVLTTEGDIEAKEYSWNVLEYSFTSLTATKKKLILLSIFVLFPVKIYKKS